MRLVFDTHALLWWFLGDPALSPLARRAIEDAGNELFVSPVSAWEIAIKYRNGRLPEAASLIGNLGAMAASQGFTELPISIRHGELAGALAGIHKDPFDRMLIAQAMAAELTLISNDAVLRGYGVALLW